MVKIGILIETTGLIRKKRRLRGGGFARGCGCGDRPADAALSVLLRLASPTMDRAADEGDVRVCLNLAISYLGNYYTCSREIR